MTGLFRQLGLFWAAANAECKSHSKMASMQRDDALEPGQRAGHRVHLLICRGCRAYSRQMNQVASLLKRAGPAGAPPEAGPHSPTAGVPQAMPADVRARLKAKLGN